MLHYFVDLFFLLNPPVIFAPTELKVRARVSTLNVTWHPSPNHTLVSGYKLSYREVEPEASATGERTAQTHTIRLRKKARYHLLTGLGKWLPEASSNVFYLKGIFFPEDYKYRNACWSSM